MFVLMFFAEYLASNGKEFLPTKIESIKSPDLQTSLSRSTSKRNFSQLLNQEEKEYLNNTSTITVCSVAQAAGSKASLELVKLLVRNVGLKLEASPPMSWQQGLAGIRNDGCDILPWATPTALRSKTMNFTRPYARIIRVIITRKSHPYISNISFLKDQTFAAEKNNHITAQLKEAYPNINLVLAEHTSEALDLVINGHANASIASLYSIGNLFNSNSLPELKIAGRLPEDFDDVVSLATSKNNIVLRNILNKAVMMTKPNEINDFMSRGAIFSYNPMIDYQMLWVILTVVFLIFSLLLYWNRYLKSLNKQLAQTHSELTEKSKQLEILSITDGLTKAYNRFKIEELLMEEINRSVRYKQPFSIFLIDIDHFKSINDEHGHLVGDDILMQFTHLLKSSLRINDFFGRWGGEEFLVICPSTTISEAQLVAEKLRSAIEYYRFSTVEKLTASFGVAQWSDGDTKEILISRADKALYLAKNNGRNLVERMT